MKKKINSEKAPKAIGPYSQAIIANDLIFVSGQLPLVYKTGNLVEGDIGKQTEIIFENIKNILNEVGCSIDDIIKTTIYLKDLNDFAVVNEIYKKYFNEPYPARTTIEVSNIPRNAKILIDVIASYKK
ncbi:MAG TPA: RidA family protein [bacterium]|nr:RidA family protein [bacterium]HOL46762.1 RidA family protein [bacterium]HPQ18198.1 RidA family protein [bacterium]